MSDNSYHNVRISYDERRKVLWSVLVEDYFSNFISTNSTVLELGAGYCDFINEVNAEKKIAIDQWPEMSKYADKSVECIIGDVTDLSDISDATIDFVFASNIFEHISQNDLSSCLSQLKNKMSPDGLLVILQPNFKRCYKDYFDDYTHVSIWTDVGLTDFLMANGFSIEQCHSGFLPLSIKSRFPVHPLLIRAYLLSPIKPMAKQMLIIARNAK